MKDKPLPYIHGTLFSYIDYAKLIYLQARSVEQYVPQSEERGYSKKYVNDSFKKGKKQNYDSKGIKPRNC